MRVQLFSNPQQMQASRTNSEPVEKCKLEASSMERIALERVISPMASHRRLPMASLKTSSAITDVATISKLLSREALADVVDLSPIMRQIGAAISRTIMPTAKGKSLRVDFCSFF